MPTLRPAQQKANERSRKELLLTAAIRHFAATGFLGARLEDVAADAGLQRPSLLYHWKTKEALYVAAVESAAEQLLDEAQRAVVAQPGPRLLPVLGAVMGLAERDPAPLRLLLRELLDRRHPGKNLVGEIFAALIGLVEAQRPELDVREALTHALSAQLVRAAAGNALPFPPEVPRVPVPQRSAPRRWNDDGDFID